MEEWYYWSDGKQAGPVEQSRLVQLISTGAVTSEDPVWRGGMADWLPAGSVPELRVKTAAFPQTISPPPVVAPVAAVPFAAVNVSVYNPAPVPAGLGQSKVGVASFIIAMVAVVIEIVGIACAVHNATPRNAAPPPSPAALHAPAAATPARNVSASDAGMVLAGLAIIGGLLLNVVGVILGIASLSMQRKRLYGVLGTIFNGGILLLVGALLLIGFIAR